MAEGPDAPRLTIAVCSMNRPAHLERAVDAILASADALGSGAYRVVVCDQSERGKRARLPEQVTHLTLDRPGIAWSRNLALLAADSELVAFVDDDCIVDKDWAVACVESSENYPDAAVIFGTVVPYPHPTSTFQLEERRVQYGWEWRGVAENGDQCFAVVTGDEPRVFDQPVLPYAQLGSSNNILLRRTKVVSAGGFSEDFGAGGIAGAAEDQELAHRLLASGHQLVFDPRFSVLHDNWQTADHASRTLDVYTAGTIAAFTSYALAGDGAAKRFLTVILSANLLGSMNLSRSTRVPATARLRRFSSVGRGAAAGCRIWWRRRVGHEPMIDSGVAARSLDKLA